MYLTKELSKQFKKHKIEFHCNNIIFWYHKILKAILLGYMENKPDEIQKEKVKSLWRSKFNIFFKSVVIFQQNVQQT